MKLLNKLFVITPFRGDDIKSLKKTINSINNNNLQLNIFHIIIYFQTNKINIDYLQRMNAQNKIYRNIILLPINESGIYKAINYGLDYIDKNGFYIVIGSGDILNTRKKEKLLIYKEKIHLLNYELSTNQKIELIRNKYTGMPYCHNAIIFQNSSLRYSNDFLISSDYDYFLNYLQKYKIRLKDISKNINYDFQIIFESQNGLSSKSKIRKNIENLKICYKYFKFKGIIKYIFGNLSKVKFKIINLIRI